MNGTAARKGAASGFFLFLHAHKSRWKLAMILKAYLDESGTHANSSVVTVSAIVATGQRWERLKPSWEAAMEGRIFHAKDFFHGAGVFRDWDAAKRARVSARLTKIVQAHVLFGTVYALPVVQYAEMCRDTPTMKPFDVRRDGVAIALRFCLGHVADRVAHVGKWGDETIALVFDRADDREFELYNQFHYLGENRADFPWASRFHSLSIADKDIENPLQCADFLAYEGYRYASQYLWGGLATAKRMPRKSFEELLKHPEIDLSYHSLETLKEHSDTRREVLRGIIADENKLRERAGHLTRARKAAHRSVAKHKQTAQRRQPR